MYVYQVSRVRKSESAVPEDGLLHPLFAHLVSPRNSLFFFTLVTGPRRSLRLKRSDKRVYEPQIRARLGTTPKHETRNTKHETRNTTLKTRNTKHETRDTRHETRNPKLDTRNSECGTRNPKPVTRNSEFGTRSPKPELTRQGMEGRWRTRSSSTWLTTPRSLAATTPPVVFDVAHYPGLRTRS